MYKLYKQLLTRPQKCNYEVLLHGMLHCRKTIHILERQIGSIDTVIEATVKDNPDLFYVGNFTYSTKEGSLLNCITPYYLFQQSEIDEMREKIRNIVHQLIKKTNRLSEWERILYVHDWLCVNVQYCETGQTSHSVIGVLLNHYAVCEGIAKSAKLIFNAMGIQSCVVFGQAKTAQSNNTFASHAWNKVKIGNNWYNLDVTFDMTLSEKHHLRHDYFLLSDDRCFIDHRELYDIDICCSSEDLNYHTVRGLLIHTPTQFREYVKKALLNGNTWIDVRISKAKEPSKIYDTVKLILDQVLNEVHICNKSINMSINENQLVITILLI